MNFLFAWRYFKAKKSTNAINVIAWISAMAIMVGTASLILLLSVFNGFEGLVKSLYADFYSELKVGPAAGKSITLTQRQLQQLKAIDGISAYSLVMEEKALLQNGEYQFIVYVKGVDDRYKKVAKLPGKLIDGAFELGTAEKPLAVLGAGVESSLLGTTAEKNILPLTIYLPKKNTSLAATNPQESLSAALIATSGAFAIQADFDNKYIITNLDFIKRMLNMQPDEYGALEISLGDKSREAEVIEKLSAIFGKGYIIQNRYEQNRSLYAVMQAEKWVIYSILSLILVVAAFTMIGSLTMLALEKQKDIQVLKAMGASDYLIQKIFLSEGMLLAFIGGLLGALLAALFCWLQRTFHLIPLQGDTFIISYYPVKMVAADFVLVLLTVFIVAWLAAWLPSWKASRQKIELRA